MANKMVLSYHAKDFSDRFLFTRHVYVQVIKSMLLWDEDEALVWHQKLANHFLRSKQDNYRTSDTILNHLVQGKMKLELLQFFRQDPRSLRIGHTKKSLVIKVKYIISPN